MYFFCGGRQKGNGCRQRYVLVDQLEEAVIDYYGTIQLEPERVEQIQADVRAQMAEQRRRGLKEAKRQERRLAELSSQRTKLLQAHYADAIPLELLKLEQDRIGQEIGEAERILAARHLAFNQIEGTLKKTLALAADLQRAYREANGRIRRMLNQALFKKLLVEGDSIRGADLNDGFAQLLTDDLVRGIYERAASRDYSGVGSNKRNLVGRAGLEPATDGL